VNREIDFTEALTRGQIFYPDPGRWYFQQKADGSFLVAGEVDGVFHIGPLIEVPDGVLPDRVNVAGVAITTPIAQITPHLGGALSKLKQAFKSPEIDGPAIVELFADPDVAAIVELMNLRTIAIAEVDAIINGLDEALCLEPEERANLIAVLLETARELYDTLVNYQVMP
jgi:hypothetical protein